MPSATLLDLLKLNTGDAATGLIEDVPNWAPEFSIVPARPRAGTAYKVTRRTGYPAGGFRGANSGVAVNPSIFKQELKEMFFYDNQMEVDEMLVKGDERTLGDLLAITAKGAVEQSAIDLGNTFWYGDGTNNNPLGLRFQISTFTPENSATAVTGQVKAGGTTNSTSAYLVDLDENVGVGFDVGMDGQFTIPPWIRQRKDDATTAANKYWAWMTNLSAYVGVSVKSALCVYVISGIDSTHPLTDILASSLLQKVPMRVRRHNLQWFINRDSEAYLTQSRTTINNNGTTAYSTQKIASGENVLPLPTAMVGYPVNVTDSILSTETNS